MGLKETGSLTEKLRKSADKRLGEEAAMSGFMKIDHVRGGNVVATIENPNYIVDVGLDEVAALLSTSGTGARFSAIAIGTDDTVTAATQTALLAESHRVVFADAVADNTATFTATFNFTGSFTVQEAGIFNNTTETGAMLSRRTFAAVNVADGDSLVITWSITVNRS